jgi:hypothetical protein
MDFMEIDKLPHWLRSLLLPLFRSLRCMNIFGIASKSSRQEETFFSAIFNLFPIKSHFSGGRQRVRCISVFGVAVDVVTR